ncbi:hypothetical protein ABL78_1055 [Leptomonas seymouri]|uniref:BBS7 beta-propeller domain-containing protein n=1 Tax=Leptomonas seymouri TaxID=5684 RepID=A0A0N1I7W9_LEPSE|nr:hypothetical protein ABL78_1055 [Leptomonas seymouri]|eukprot:KPI89792.1 hypothetical protein ABL78_1055 [Leptomonas seymouri]
MLPMASLEAPPALAFKRKVLTKSATTARGCLLVYPVGKKAKQRVAVGDSTGLFKVFSIGKRLEPVLAFETLETVVPSGGADKDERPITAATLYSDQLFFIQGSVLHAYSRKGKPFFTVDTNVTEKVSALAIDTPYIFIAGDFMVTTMNETKEIGFYLSPDRVNDMCVYVSPSATSKDGERQLEEYICCLACNDRVLRLIQSNKLMEEVGCEAALTTLVFDQSDRLLYYGTQSGSIGVMSVKGNGGLRKVGSSMPISTGGSSSSVSSFGLADADADGRSELLVGYDDGTVNVFALQQTRSSNSAVDSVALSLVWTCNVGERVTSVAGGVITGSPEQPDILVHTYSGQVINFTLDTDTAKEDVQAAAAEAADRQAALLAKQQDMQREIDQLRSLIAQRTAELSVAPPVPASKKPAPPVLMVSATFTLTVTFTPLEAAPLLSLVIFADVPLEGAMLRCNAQLTFVSTGSAVVKTRARAGATATASSSAVSSSPVIATISPVQHGSKRLEVHLWADEGVEDTLQITAYSGQAPRAAQVKYVPLYALPLYERVSSDSAAALAPGMVQAMSRWIVLGNFVGQDVLEWMGQLLPGLADIPHRATTHRHIFVSDFLQSTLVLELEEPETGNRECNSRAVFSCNSLVTLATVKRHLSQTCAQLGVTITTREHVLFLTAQRQLQQLYPIMEGLSTRQQRLQLLQGLRELQGAESDLSFLPSSLQEVLTSADVEVEAEAELHQEMYVQRTVAALYRSLVFFKGHAPPLSDAVQARLDAASCGLGFDAALLERIFFPHDELLKEASALGTGDGSACYPSTAVTPLTTEADAVAAAHAKDIGGAEGDRLRPIGNPDV